MSKKTVFECNLCASDEAFLGVDKFTAEASNAKEILSHYQSHICQECLDKISKYLEGKKPRKKKYTHSEPFPS